MYKHTYTHIYMFLEALRVVGKERTRGLNPLDKRCRRLCDPTPLSLPRASPTIE